MATLRPLLARLLAIALVVAGAPSLGSRAPQALRAWIDVAGEVAPATTVARRRPSIRRQARVCLANLARPSRVSRVAPPLATNRPDAAFAGRRLATGQQRP